MRSFVVAVLLASAAVLMNSAVASVQEKVEAAKASGKPLVFAVDKDQYTCSSCNPPVTVKVSGKDHSGEEAVTGHSEYNKLLVKVVSPTDFEVLELLDGKHQAYYHYKVAADGQTLNVKWQDYSGPKVTSGGYTAKRVGPAPAGAHAISGSWQIEQTTEETSSAKAKYKSTCARGRKGRG